MGLGCCLRRSKGLASGAMPEVTGTRWGSRLLVALFIASFASVASVRLLIQFNQPPVVANFAELTPGRISGQPVEAPETATPAPDPIIIRLSVDRAAYVSTYLEDAGLDSDKAKTWAKWFRSAAGTPLIMRGHSLTLYKDPVTSDLRGLRYDLDTNVAIDEQGLGSGVVRASRELIEYDLKRIAVEFRVSDGFDHDAVAHDLPRPIVATLENAFIDVGPLDKLRPGSLVELLYQEKVSRDGSYRTVTGVEAAEIKEGDKTLTAFAFRDSHGHPCLFDADGRALGPRAIRFPVDFDYISSGFSYHRYHPILHEFRPHLGVDFATKYGTPVKAVADGRIEQAGWCGELGRCVRIDHENDMVSIYGHLSEITSGLAPGTSVQAGEMIGRIGSSGLSTGPHLHFAVQKEGVYVNPLTQMIGSNHQVSPRMRELFDRFKQGYLAQLDKLPHLGSHFRLVSSPDESGSTSSGGLVSYASPTRPAHHRWRAIRTASY